MKKLLIYLASPYSDERNDIIERRVRAVQRATAKLIEQGNLIFSPIVHSHPIADQVTFSPINTAEAMSGWTQYDHDFIDHCDEVWVLMIEGWDTSRGVSDEIAYAYAHQIPVRFVSYPEIIVSERSYTAFNPLPHIRACRLDNVYDQADGFAGHTCDENCPSIMTGDNFEFVINEAVPIDTIFVSPRGKSIFDDLFNSKPVSIAFKVEPHGDFSEFTKAVDLSEFPPSLLLDGARYSTSNIFSPPSSGLPPLSKAPTPSLPEDSDERNSYPMAEGLLYYFPNALAEVSRWSQIGNDKHNPGEAMHWAREKSTDHANKIIRHLVDAGKKDADGNRHSVGLAWRALALLQVELENELGLPLPKNAK